MKNTTKITAGVAAIVAGSLAFGAAANAKTYVLRMGAGHPSKPVAYVRNMEHHMADMITKRVAAETKHKIRFIHAYAGKIAKVHETLEAVEKGLLDIGGSAFASKVRRCCRQISIILPPSRRRTCA